MEIKKIKRQLTEQERLAKKNLPARCAKAFMKAPDTQCAMLIAGIALLEMGYFKHHCNYEPHYNCLCDSGDGFVDYDYTFSEFWHRNVELFNVVDELSPKAVRHIRFRMKRLRSWYLRPHLKRRYRRTYKRCLGNEIKDGCLSRLAKPTAHF